MIGLWIAAALAFDAFAAPPEAVKPQLVVQMGHTGGVRSVAVSPDGKYLATGGFDHTARLWDLATGEELRVIRGYTTVVSALAFTPDGKYLVTGAGHTGEGGSTVDAECPARLWDLASGALVRTFKPEGVPAFSVLKLSVTPDGKHLVVGEAVGRAHLYELRTGRWLRTFEGQFLAITPDGTQVATARSSHYQDDEKIEDPARLWDLASGAPVRALEDLKADFGDRSQAAFTPDGSRLVAVSDAADERSVHVIDPSTGQETLSYPFEDIGPAEPFALTPGGEYLVHLAEDGSGRLREAASGRELRKLSGGLGGTWAAAVAPGGGRIAAGSALFDTATGKPVRAFLGRATKPQAVAFSRDGRWLAVGGEDEAARVWSLSAGTLSGFFAEKGQHIHSVELSTDGKLLLTGSADGKARLWDAASGRELRDFTGSAVEMYPVTTSLSRDAKRLATFAPGDAVRIWDVASGRRLSAIPGRASEMALTPDGRFVVAAGEHGARLFDAETAKLVRAYAENQDHTYNVALSPEGKSLATRDFLKPKGSDRTISTLHVWDVDSGREIRALKETEPSIYRLALSKEGKYLLGWTPSDVSRLWDAATGRLLRAFRDHQDDVDDMALSADGRFLASASRDGTVRVGELVGGRELCRLISLGKDWVAVSPEGYFDGSPEGLRSIRWSVGLKSYPLEAFSEGYYVPGLLARLISGEKLSSAELPRLSQGFRLPPSAKIASPADGASFREEEAEVRVDAEDLGGGVDEIRLYHNGKAVGSEGRGMKLLGRSQTFHVRLTEGQNRFRAVAISRDRIEGKSDEIGVALQGAERRPTLHLLAVGLNQYKNPALNLNYAKPDAQAILDFFSSSPKTLFKEVRRRELMDGAATRQSIEAQLKELESSRPEDVVIIYLAGHGESLENAWYFLPYELLYPERENEIKEKGLSSTQLKDALTRIGAQKVLLLMDACNSGSALLAFAGRGFEGRKALSQLARAAGVHIVAASTKDQLAAEVKELGHGVFTYTLLEGLKGKAANGEAGTVTVRGLLAYVENNLPELSARYKTEAQYPVVDSRGMDFPLTTAR